MPFSGAALRIREGIVLSRSHLWVVALLAACGGSPRGTSTAVVEERRSAKVDASEELSQDLVRCSTAVIEALADETATPPPSNSYSHQRLLGPRRRLGEPQVHLEASDNYSLLASTDCSGWLSFALNTVSPLHEAVLQAQRSHEAYNRVYSEDFALRESRRPWSRAFVVTNHLRSEEAATTGFEPVPSFEDLREGDIGAYSMGRYTKPSDEDRPKPRDTGHVFIVTGRPTLVDPNTKNYDGRGSLSKKAAKVIAVPVVDSSATVHFDPDSRKDEAGRYTLPPAAPHSRAKPGGLGTGTIWFALSEEGRVLQRRLGPQQRYRAVLARAARLHGRIVLDEVALDGGGSLLVKVFDNAPAIFAGISYGDEPIHLTGEGGLRLGSGRLVLNGDNDFTGGVTVQAADLIVTSRTGLGVGDVTVRGGSMTLLEPAISASAALSVSEDLPKGAIRLDFRGRNVVRALQLRGELHRCGTWGGPESGAMFVDPVFSGRGVLQLAAKPLEACAPVPDGMASRRPRRRSASKLRAGIR